MKKKIILWVSIPVLLIGVWIFSVSSKGKSPADVTNLKMKYAAENLIPLNDSFTEITEAKKMLGIKTPEGVSKEVSLAANEWAKKGYLFLTDFQVEKLLETFNFIMAPSSSYKGDIPADQAALIVKRVSDLALDRFFYQMVCNYQNDRPINVPPSALLKKFQSGDYHWAGERFDVSDFITKEFMEEQGIMEGSKWFLHVWENGEAATQEISIIAGSEKFDTEALSFIKRIFTKPPPPDPIVVVKVAHGYIEIASWD